MGLEIRFKHPMPAIFHFFIVTNFQCFILKDIIEEMMGITR